MTAENNDKKIRTEAENLNLANAELRGLEARLVDFHPQLRPWQNKVESGEFQKERIQKVIVGEHGFVLKTGK